ncbi:hypothetical protein IE53DRAFT_189231 [Violaceomyces palustris]|uniref:Uncharacterized protein n=1 Tax=Violaceomyces palustris TaxID=1673888 RepID=A0ACD0P8A8_9BASI|nr:hypothetical protein IE53DRAFT_189231 [Violaceomyces palustris]
MADNAVAGQSDRKRNRACLECRFAKVRCHPLLTSSGQQACQRCNEHGFRCMFVYRKQKKPPRSHLDPVPPSESRSSSCQPSSSQPSVLPSVAADPTPQVLLEPPSPFSTDIKQRARLALEERRARPGSGFTFASEWSATQQSSSLRVMLDSLDARERHSVTLRSILEPLSMDSNGHKARKGKKRPRHEERGEDEHRFASSLSTEVATTGPADPVLSGLLTPTEARSLVSFYMRYIDLWCPILDPQLHTHDWIRDRSLFLYCVVCYQAARFCPKTFQEGVTYDVPQKSPISEPLVGARRLEQLRSLVAQHACHTFGCGIRTIECTQAFYIRAGRRDKDDPISHLQNGYGFRLALDLDLDAQLSPSGPDLTSNANDAQSRDLIRYRNRLRTFLALYNQDRVQAQHYFFQKCSFGEHSWILDRSSEWHTDRYAYHRDILVSLCSDCHQILSRYKIILRTSKTASDRSRGVEQSQIVLDLFESEFDGWQARWEKRLADQPPLPPEDATNQADHLSTRLQMVKIWRGSASLHVASIVLHHQLTHLQQQRDLITSQPMGAQWATEKSLALLPCIRAAHNILTGLSALPPQVLRLAPDSITLLAPHAAVILLHLACLPWIQTSATVFLPSSIDLMARMRDRFQLATESEEDNVALHAHHLSSILEILGHAGSDTSGVEGKSSGSSNPVELPPTTTATPSSQETHHPQVYNLEFPTQDPSGSTSGFPAPLSTIPALPSAATTTTNVANPLGNFFDASQQWNDQDLWAQIQALTQQLEGGVYS